MKIILDFDYTIFDTAKFRNAIQTMFSGHGVDAELFARSIEESRGTAGDWKPDKQLEILESRGMSKISSMRDGFNSLTNNSQEYLYTDTMPFLKRMSKDHNFVVLSYGQDKFQGMKIRGCREAYKYFDNILVTHNLSKDKEASEIANKEPAIFIEDNPTALSASKKYAPSIITVRLNRGEGRHAIVPSGDGVDHEVESLGEVENLIMGMSNYK